MFRDVLLKMLQTAKLEKRGSLLREICIIDEHLQQIGDEDKG